MVTDLNKKAALGRRNRRGNTIKRMEFYSQQDPEFVDIAVRNCYERDVPLAQAAMVKFSQKMLAKSVKVIWFASGKTDITRMLKDCKMWAEKIPQDIANAESGIGSYFRGAGKIYYTKIFKKSCISHINVKIRKTQRLDRPIQSNYSG